MERIMEEDSGHCCLVAIGRLQVTSTPNISDLSGSNSNAGILGFKLSVLNTKFFFMNYFTNIYRIHISTFHGWQIYICRSTNL